MQGKGHFVHMTAAVQGTVVVRDIVVVLGIAVDRDRATVELAVDPDRGTVELAVDPDRATVQTVVLGRVS